MAGGMIHHPRTYVVRGFRGVPCRSTQAHHTRAYRRGQELAREVRAELVRLEVELTCPECCAVVKRREYAWATTLGTYCRGACVVQAIENQGAQRASA